jgi:hypothetical protein
MAKIRPQVIRVLCALQDIPIDIEHFNISRQTMRNIWLVNIFQRL